MRFAYVAIFPRSILTTLFPAKRQVMTGSLVRSKWFTDLKRMACCGFHHCTWSDETLFLPTIEQNQRCSDALPTITIRRSSLHLKKVLRRSFSNNFLARSYPLSFPKGLQSIRRLAPFPTGEHLIFPSFLFISLFGTPPKTHHVRPLWNAACLNVSILSFLFIRSTDLHLGDSMQLCPPSSPECLPGSRSLRLPLWEYSWCEWFPFFLAKKVPSRRLDPNTLQKPSLGGPVPPWILPTSE